MAPPSAIDDLDLGRQGSKSLASWKNGEAHRRVSFKEGVHYKVNHHQTPNAEEWKDHTSDLRSVLDVVKQLFLVLQHSNEALIRVALEIVLDGQAADLLTWSYESIFEEEDNHRWLSTLVDKKLELALKFHPGAVGSEFSCKKTVTSDVEVQTEPEENLEIKQKRLELDRLKREAEETRQRTSNALEQVNFDRRRLQKEVQRKQEKIDTAEERAREAEEKLQKLQEEPAASCKKCGAAQDAAPAPVLPSPTAKDAATRKQPTSPLLADPAVCTAETQDPTLLMKPRSSQKQDLPQDDPRSSLRLEQQQWPEHAHLAASAPTLEQQQLEQAQQKARAPPHELQDEGTQTAGLAPEEDPRLQQRLDAANQRIIELEAKVVQAAAPANDCKPAVAGACVQTDAVTSHYDLCSGEKQEMKPHLGVMLAGIANRMEAVREHCRQEGVSEGIAAAADNRSFLKALTVWERLFQDGRARKLRHKECGVSSSAQVQRYLIGADGGPMFPSSSMEDIGGSSHSSEWRSRAVHKAAEKLCRVLKRNRMQAAAFQAMEEPPSGRKEEYAEEKAQPLACGVESHRLAPLQPPPKAALPAERRQSASQATAEASLPMKGFVSNSPVRRSTVGGANPPNARSTSGLLASLPAMHGSVPLGVHRQHLQPHARQRQRSTPSEDLGMEPILSTKSLQGFRPEGAQYTDIAAHPNAAQDLKVLESMRTLPKLMHGHDPALQSEGFQTIRKAGHRARGMMSTVGAHGFKGSNARCTSQPPQ